jgi:hypothetical protein
METYSNVGTFETPTIFFDLDLGSLEIKGRSIPENPIEFYQPLFEALGRYEKMGKLSTSVNIKLEYYNSSSSKCILDMLKKLETINENGNKVSVNWYYEEEDENMLLAGEDYRVIIKLPFKMVKMID